MTRPRSSFAAATAASATGLAAVALGSAPWIAGTIVVVEPGAARLALAAAALSGIASIGVAALARRAHPALRGTVLTLGLLAAASGPAFVALLAQQQPAEPRQARPG